MGLVTRLLDGPEKRMTLSDLDTLMDRAIDGIPSATGLNISEENALRCSAVWACVAVLADTISTLPFPVYRRLPGGGKERATEHYLYPLLHDEPNPEMTAVDYWDCTVGHLALWGNHYGEIQWGEDGRVKALWPLRPDRMNVERNDQKRLVYKYRLSAGETLLFDRYQIMHIRRRSGNGIIGYSPIREVRETIGLALATQEYGARFFGNDSRPGGVLEHPGRLSDPAMKHLKDSWEETHRGLSNAHRVAILEEGLSWKQVGIPPEDAQYLETRRFQVEEIARVFRIPPHLIQENTHSTYSNIEHAAIDFVVHTIRPWVVGIEQRVKKDLFLPEEKKVYFPAFLVDGLLRGDIDTRYKAYQVGINSGFLCGDDVREKEDLNPLPNGLGKKFYMPLNMAPVDQLGEEPASTEEPARGVRSLTEGRASANLGRRRLRKAYYRLFADAMARVVKREEADVMRAAEKQLTKRDYKELDLWLESFYAGHPEYVERTFAPVLLSYAEAVQGDAALELGVKAGMTDEMERFTRLYGTNLARDHAYSSLGQLRDVLRKAGETGADPLEALRLRFGEWRERRPDKAAKQHTVEAGEAVAVETYRQHGVTKLVWRTHGTNCPYCNRLNGKVVGIDHWFVGKDETLEGGEGDEPMRVSRNTRHAPAHNSCDCSTSADITSGRALALPDFAYLDGGNGHKDKSLALLLDEFKGLRGDLKALPSRTVRKTVERDEMGMIKQVIEETV